MHLIVQTLNDVYHIEDDELLLSYELKSSSYLGWSLEGEWLGYTAEEVAKNIRNGRTTIKWLKKK